MSTRPAHKAIKPIKRNRCELKGRQLSFFASLYVNIEIKTWWCRFAFNIQILLKYLFRNLHFLRLAICEFNRKKINTHYIHTLPTCLLVPTYVLLRLLGAAFLLACKIYPYSHSYCLVVLYPWQKILKLCVILINIFQRSQNFWDGGFGYDVTVIVNRRAGCMSDGC